VLSGLEEEPQNWFMSAAGNPFDWDYSPASSSPTQAVAGNNSDTGELGDVVTALAPFQDDVMVIGGANTLWIMRGDPAAGGQIDNISRRVGIVGPEAWAYDVQGNFYFVSLNGLYRMAVGSGELTCVSRNRLDSVFRDLNTAIYRVFLHYDIRWQGLHIFIVPDNEPTAAVVSYWWDERTDSFWPDKYPTVVGPIAALAYDADDPADTAIIIGGFDGYLRAFDDDALDDDGTAIESYVDIGPIHPGSVVASSRISDINVLTAKASGDVLLDVFAGHSVEDVREQTTARVRRTVSGGRNLFFRNRIAQNAMMIRLSQTSATKTWAYEGGSYRQEVITRMRGRGI